MLLYLSPLMHKYLGRQVLYAVILRPRVGIFRAPVERAKILAGRRKCAYKHFAEQIRKRHAGLRPI